MNNEKLLYGVAGLGLGIIITWIVASSGTQMLGSRNSMMTDMGDVDEHFIDQMIPHHEDAVTMSELALVKAEHQELKDLPQRIITVQNQEVEQMKQWRKDWFGLGGLLIKVASAHGFEHGLNMGMMGDTSDLEELENAQPFDKKFIEEMIPHHQMAVMMARMLLNTTQRTEMKKLANDIVSSQNQEIEQMRAWYKAWY